MKKIERYIIDTSCECGRYGDDVNSFEDKVGDWCKSDAVSQLENIIEELVRMLTGELKKDEFLLAAWPGLVSKKGTNGKIKYLETLTGKTWEELKRERK